PSLSLPGVTVTFGLTPSLPFKTLLRETSLPSPSFTRIVGPIGLPEAALIGVCSTVGVLPSLPSLPSLTS
ncbi:hypothetical protein HK300_00040, partial [Streptococcus agalactiae]|nr:hypothetical protein [Streptococcus agalactiae]